MSLKEQFEKTISTSLTPASIKKLENGISSYVDRNSELLMSLDFSKRFSFDDKDRGVVYDAVGVTSVQMDAAVKASKTIYKNNKIQSNPFYHICVLTARDFLKKKKKDLAELVLFYMSLNMYTSVHKGSFKYNANKQIMDYTISHLDANFIITKLPSLYAFIMDNTKTVLETYSDRILSGEDRDLVWVIDATWNRIKQKIQRLASVYYENHKSGRYLNADVDQFNDLERREIDNDSFLIDRLSNKVYIKLVSRQYDTRLIKYAITKSDTSYLKAKNLIEDIIDGDENNELRRVISSMITYYLVTSGKSADYIARGDFISYMKSAYGSNTNHEDMLYVKEVIGRWLAENLGKYGRGSSSKTTIAEYRRTIYMFFVFVINNEAKIS